MSEQKGLHFDPPARNRGIYCNRTLNLRSIRAIGYDMDYTIVHYRPEEWEQRAYEHTQRGLAERGWPVEELAYDPGFISRGLILDTELGNIVKANRFGYIKQAFHGTKPIPFDKLREHYARTIVDLSESRWSFLNTLFSLSLGCMFAQTVDLLDRGKIKEALGYRDLMDIVSNTLNQAHTEGLLKADILADPGSYIVLDEEIPQALLDQKQAGKRLALITNSDWEYTREILAFAVDPFLPGEMTWRELFDLTFVSARKPSFFTDANPAFEVVNDEGLLRPVVGELRDGGIYVGGHAAMIERLWGLSGEEVLYIGDHLFSDVRVSKAILRWRSGLIIRELEEELGAVEAFEEEQQQLSELMRRKEELEYQSNRVRLTQLRLKSGYLPPLEENVPSGKQLQADADRLRNQLQQLDESIGALARSSGTLVNPHWGLVFRAGNDKSHLTRQVESYADIYMSRVSNFLRYTPFAYLRSPRASLPHDSPESGA